MATLRNEGKKVLLHCVAAYSRTPAVAIAYAMLRGVRYDQAEAEVSAALPHSEVNRGFREALRRMDNHSLDT